MLRLPSELKDPIKLADWLELLAILSADRNASYGDLSGALRVTGAFEVSDRVTGYSLLNQDERIDEMCGKVFNELHSRAQAAGHGYPFEIDAGSVLQIKPNREWEDFPVYIFCLCLSFFGAPSTENAPRQLFEEVSRYAAKKFLDGDVVKFSPPRDGKKVSKSFQKAIGDLCNWLGEGDGYRPRKKSRMKPKDDRVDLVAWKDFPDARPSKIVLFGQCASNRYWEDIREKLSELQPDKFCQHWMISVPVSQILRSFFFPHRLELEEWLYAAQYAGILFDRCRIAYWAHGESPYSHHWRWVNSTCLSGIVLN
jgi:hypothetical protein